MITAIVMGIIVFLVWKTWFTEPRTFVDKDAKEKEAEETPSRVSYTPEELFMDMGGELKFQSDEDEHGNTRYFVAFQGGNFNFSFTKGSNWVNMYFPDFHTCKSEHLNNALFTANRMNLKYSGWGCSINMYDADKNENPVTASLYYALTLDERLEVCAKQLKKLMAQAFFIARDFCTELDERIKIHKDIDEDLLTDWGFQNRIAHIQWLKSMDRTEQMGEEFPDYPSTLSVGALVKLFDNVDFGCLQNLRIVCGEKVETMTDIAEIEAFNIREYIRQRPDAREIKSLNLTFGFEHQELFVNLTKAKASTENTLIYVVNIVRSGSELDKVMDNRISFSSRTMLEVRLTDAEKDYWEAKYMIDEAMDKINDGRTDELTNEQILLSEHTNPSIQSELYWGKKYYNNHCYLQALYHFNRVFSYLKSDPNNWDEEAGELYGKLAFYIGFIYNDLGMYDRAFYYLHVAQRTRIDGIQEFINCLCNMKDVSARNYIREQTQEVINQMRKSDEEADRLTPFYLFLCRRYVYVLIDHGDLDEAEQMLNGMVANEQDVEFAKGELEYIQNLRIIEEVSKLGFEEEEEENAPTEEETKSEAEKEKDEQEA